MRILDLGCGTGAIAREVAPKIVPGEVVGVDRQDAQLQTARRRATELGVDNIRFVEGEAADLGFRESEFDAAYCRFLLEHVASPVDVVREMARVIKSGGWVCAFEWENGCAVDYPDSPAIAQVWQALYRLQEDLGGDPWIARKLYGVFHGAGLCDVKIEGRVWTVTADQKDKLRLYVDGAREIIRQGREGLLRRRYVSEELLSQADEEYGRLLVSPTTFAMHGFCCALAVKGDG